MTPKRCGCGRTFDALAWAELPYVGRQDDGEELLELRNCPCGTTLAVEAGPSSAGGWRVRNRWEQLHGDAPTRWAALLEELAAVAQTDADNVGGDPYAWPPRPALSPADVAEYQRLRVLSRQLDYHATEVRAGIRPVPENRHRR